MALRPERRRNPVARSPLLRKGGAHATPRRRRKPEPLTDALAEWREEYRPSDQWHDSG